MNLDQIFELKARAAAEGTYVLVAEKRNGDLILIPDPGLNRPWSTKNLKLADAHAQTFQKMPDFTKVGPMTIAAAFNLIHQQFLKKNENLTNPLRRRVEHRSRRR